MQSNYSVEYNILSFLLTLQQRAQLIRLIGLGCGVIIKNTSSSCRYEIWDADRITEDWAEGNNICNAFVVSTCN